jgi:hypothetical protein
VKIYNAWGYLQNFPGKKKKQKWGERYKNGDYQAKTK